MTNSFGKTTFFLCLFLLGSAASQGRVLAQSQEVESIRQKISERELAIKGLEEEIAKAELEIDKSRGQQKTLANTIKIYDAERRKLLAQIRVTTERVESKELEIKSLGVDINEKNIKINNEMDGLSELLREKSAFEGEATLIAMLNNQNLSSYWDSLRRMEILTASISGHVSELKNTKADLEKSKVLAEGKRKQLKDLSKQLSGEKQAAEATLAEKQKLLRDTKNRESEYQRILREKIAAKEAFEKELLEFESELNFAIDPSSIPAVGRGVLSWPLDVIKITQYFGNTAFAASHAKLYNGAGHNGIDLGAPVGTPIKAAQSGFVMGTGDTDVACPGASYGKWVLIQHSNGLSTLYAHLSAITAKAGENVAPGEIIGLSGNTGYTTGPHLHFTVYVTKGVRVMARKSKVCNGSYTMPVADLKAYLNPLSYL